MPIARLISRSPDDCQKLADQLRSLGYQVEINFPDPPVEVSHALRFTVEEALARLEGLSGADNLVFLIIPKEDSKPVEIEAKEEAVTNAAAPAAEFVPPSDWPIWLPLDEPMAASEHSLHSETGPETESSSLLNERMFWRAAAGVAALAVIMLLWLMPRHQRAPLPSSISTGEPGTSMPFHASETSTLARGQTSIDVRPAAITTYESTGDNAVSEGHATEPTAKQASQSDDGFVAKDTVTRYGKRAAATGAASSQKKSGVKYYSDLK